jgi:hypothetical protein
MASAGPQGARGRLKFKVAASAAAMLLALLLGEALARLLRPEQVTKLNDTEADPWCDYDLEQPQRRVSELARSLDVPCVDVLSFFREEGSHGGLYFDFGTHWNAREHALAARLLAPALEAPIARSRRK